VSRYQKGKPIWILPKQEIVSGSGISWVICKSAPRSTPAPHHLVFTGRMAFLPPNQQHQSTEGTVDDKKLTLSSSVRTESKVSAYWFLFFSFIPSNFSAYFWSPQSTSYRNCSTKFPWCCSWLLSGGSASFELVLKQSEQKSASTFRHCLCSCLPRCFCDSTGSSTDVTAYISV